MQEKLKNILEESKKQLENASTLQEAEETRVKILGKKEPSPKYSGPWEAFPRRKESSWDRQPTR